jgi:hypothetical protein
MKGLQHQKVPQRKKPAQPLQEPQFHQQHSQGLHSHILFITDSPIIQQIAAFLDHLYQLT